MTPSVEDFVDPTLTRAVRARAILSLFLAGAAIPTLGITVFAAIAFALRATLDLRRARFRGVIVAAVGLAGSIGVAAWLASILWQSMRIPCPSPGTEGCGLPWPMTTIMIASVLLGIAAWTFAGRATEEHPVPDGTAI